MTEHLPECPTELWCICSYLRACEARVRGRNTYISGYDAGYKEAEDSTLNAILRIIDRNKHEGSYCFVVHACDIIEEIELIRETTED